MKRLLLAIITIVALTAPTLAEAQERRGRSAGPGGGPPPLTGEELEAAKAMVAELVASPRPSAEEMIGYVGTWEGTLEHDGAVLERLSVTFEIRDGEVVGETKGTTSDGRRETYPAPFIRFVDDGKTLEWGVESGQFGGGVGVYRVALSGDGELTGVMQIRGVQFALPPGMELPEPVVVLKRST